MQTAALPVLSAAGATQAERLAAALAGLNAEQRAAVEHGVGALAGEGTGGQRRRNLLHHLDPWVASF